MSDQSLDGSEWVKCWQRASQRMEQLRREELDRIDLAQVIQALEESYLAARAAMERSTTSGLVEQQALFMRGRQ